VETGRVRTRATRVSLTARSRCHKAIWRTRTVLAPNGERRTSKGVISLQKAAFLPLRRDAQAQHDSASHPPLLAYAY